MNMKFSSTHVVALFALSLLLVASCSYTSSAVSNINNVPAIQSEATPKNQSPQTEVKSPLPPPTGFVNDYANVINPESQARLESVLTELRDKADIEFAVVTIETTGEEPISDYSLAVARGWGIGPKDSSKGGGLLLVLAIKDRKWKIQISRSLEKDLPDEALKELGDQSKDLYRQGKYAEGITKYVKAVIERLEEIRGVKLSGKP
jgi:uncharacterized protein